MKDITDFKVGMNIKICEDPSNSINLFYGKSAKLLMAGTIQKIVKISYSKNAVCVKRNGKGNWWTLHLDDIRRIDPPSKIKPMTFDPEQLVF